MTICTGCQTQNRDGVRFCKNCGQPMTTVAEKHSDEDTQPIAVHRCSQCGNPIRPGSHFCKVCGSPTSPLTGSPQNTTTCPSCGAQISEDGVVCKECGLALQTEPPNRSQITDRIGSSQKPKPPITPNRVTICANCGAQLRNGASYCRICGARSGPLERIEKIAVKNLINDPSPTPPERFGTGELLPQQIVQERYFIIEKVAQGGMGAVYKARDDRLGGKIVALKEMSEAGIAVQDRNDILEAFNREAELLARLNHPNLVRVTDRFQEGLYHYMVMEFIEGRTFAQLIEGTKKPFTEDRVVLWAEQLCDALHYLHNQEPVIIYRDLKPGNIMVIEETDQIKLIDFGIARFYKQGKSKDTIAFGTEGYAPPEQYGSGQTDARADIYALGVTLHELLTLQDPGQHIMGLRNVRTINPRINPVLANAIEKAVQQDRRNRHLTITEMWEAMSGKPAKWVNHAFNLLSYEQKQGKTAAGGSQSTFVAPGRNPGVIRGQFFTVNFGEITARSKPFQHSRKLAVPPGKQVSVTAADHWVHVHPATLTSAGGDLLITIDTQLLRPGRRIRSGGLFRWWVNLHAARLVPETLEHRSYINLKNNWADNERINLVVLTKPEGWRVFAGWLIVISAMFFELAVVLILIAMGLFWLGW